MSRLILTAMASASVLLGNVCYAAPVAGDGATAEERAHTAQLNRAQADRAAAETDVFNSRVATVAAEVEAARVAYASDVAAYEAEKARIAAMSAEEYVQWQADVAACKAGDTSRCAVPAPRP